jgi:Zn-dependent protease with chaperone function
MFARFIMIALALVGVVGVAHGADFDAQTATQAYLDTVAGEARERSDAYFMGGYWLQLVDILVALVIAFILLQSGFAKKTRDKMLKSLRWRWAAIMGFFAIYTLTVAVLGFPLSYYEDFMREHAYDLSNQSFMGWFVEDLKGLAIGIAFGAPFALIFYTILRVAKRSWWMWGTAVSIFFLALTLFISPVYISPIFNDYTPMEAGPLKSRILAMADANGVPADNIYVFDTSRQSGRITANVSGLFGTTRISLGDNLLTEGTDKEVEAVMGHELGHYVLGHSIILMISFGLVLLAGFAFVNFAFPVVVRAMGKNWGIEGIDDIAGLPLLMVLLSVFFLFATPVTNTIVRTSEAEADIFGLNVARAPDGFAAIAMKLASYRKLEPGRWEEIIFYDHPSGYARVAMAMRWKAAQLRIGATDIDPAIAPLATANTDE